MGAKWGVFYCADLRSSDSAASCKAGFGKMRRNRPAKHIGAEEMKATLHALLCSGLMALSLAAAALMTNAPIY